MYHDHGAGHNFMMMMITTLPVPHRSRPAKIRWLIHSESVCGRMCYRSAIEYNTLREVTDPGNASHGRASPEAQIT